MKKWKVVLACAAAAVLLTACGAKSGSAGAQQTPGGAQLANPFENCATLADAAKLSGFDMAVPERAQGYTGRTVQAVRDKMVQVIDTGEDRELLMRKAAGGGDISGDYNTYQEISAAVIGGRQVTLKGSGGRVSVAVWTDGGYAYAVDADGDGLPRETMENVVQAIR